MLIVFASLAASQMAPPDEALARELRREIWDDILSNAWIGNGNELLARWANAGDHRAGERPLQIQDLLCRGGADRLRCRFGLLREGGVAMLRGEPVPDRLACRVTFRWSERGGDWYIPRLPPGPQGGHSRITIRCEPTR